MTVYDEDNGKTKGDKAKQTRLFDIGKKDNDRDSQPLKKKSEKVKYERDKEGKDIATRIFILVNCIHEERQSIFLPRV